nr:hypothetical protein [Candidatus Sigynarchaeota archaeon]
MALIKDKIADWFNPSFLLVASISIIGGFSSTSGNLASFTNTFTEFGALYGTIFVAILSVIFTALFFNSKHVNNNIFLILAQSTMFVTMLCYAGIAAYVVSLYPADFALRNVAIIDFLGSGTPGFFLGLHIYTMIKKPLAIAREKRRLEELQKYLSLRTFSSPDPEALIENIKKLHERALKSVDERNLDEAVLDLEAELVQYTKVIQSFKKIKSEVLASKAETKREGVSAIMFKVHEAIFTERYQERFAELAKAKEVKKFDETEKILSLMSTLVNEQVQREQAQGNAENVKKYMAILGEIRDNFNINSFFVELSNVETMYNKVRDYIARGALHEAMKLLGHEGPLIDTLCTRLVKITGTSNEFKQLIQDATKLQSLVMEASKSVTAQYERMMEGEFRTPLAIEAFTSSLQLPRLSNLSDSADLETSIAELDEQFAKWKKAEKDKNGKI